MPRPKNKSELLEMGKENFEKLNSYIDQLTPQQQETEFPEGTINRNIRDILAHMHHWHLMMIEWYKAGMSGKKPEMPAPGYSWKTTPELNKKIWKTYTDIPLKKTRNLFETSFQNVRKIINSHSDKDLFTKKKYPWTGSTSMGSYLVSATSSHYDWGLKLIKKANKKK